MPGTGSGADGVRSGRRARPIGLSAGSLGLVAAWLGGAAITRLTGAAPVVLVMAAGFVLAVAAAVAGLLTVLRVSVGPVDLPPTSTAGAPVRVRIPVQTSRPVHLVCRMGGATIGAGWVTDGLWDGALTFERRGRVDELQVAVRSAGPVGLLWWERRAVVPIDRADGHLVAPPAGHGTATVETAEVAAAGDAPGVPGASVGDVDGVRPWREGDAEHAVHWPSTLRSRSLVVRDRLHDTGGRWIVRARPAPDDPDREAGLVRRTLEDGLRLGVDLHVAVGDGPSTPVADRSAALAWTATADLGRGRLPEPAVVRWWQRQVVLGARRIEPETTASVSTRWWAAAATMVSLAMLVGALGYSPGVLAAALIGVAGGSLVSSRSLVSGDPPSGVVRAVTGVGALGALVLVAASSGRLDDMLSFLRGPLPQVLIVLIVLHGFECRDRRTIRVSLAISAVVVMYAAGFRVDDRVGWWIVVWSLAVSVTLAKMSGPTAWSASTAWPRWGARIATAAGGVVATVGVLVVVPVPDGPAALTLPTFVEDGLAPVGRPGALVGPAGDLRDATAPVTSEPSRAPAG